MRFRVERDVLVDAVSWAARTLPAKPQPPVLAGLRLAAGTDHALTVSSFDYVTASAAVVEVTASEAGEVLVPGKLLAEITRSLPSQLVELSTDPSRAVLSCGNARFSLPTLPLEDYPAMPAMPVGAGTVGSDAFAAAVSSVAIAANRDETLPVLTGVRLEIEGDQITLVATDRYRLAIRTLRWQPDDPQLSRTALVPARTLGEVARALTGGAQVQIALTGAGTGDGGADGIVGFAGAGRRTTTRLIEGEFPKYRSLLPADVASRAEVATAPLVEAVKRVAIVATLERTPTVRLTFRPDGLLLEAGGSDEAQASETLPAAFDGEELGIAFNATFLLDGLAAIDSDTACFAFTTPSRPAVLTGKADGAGDYIYLLMPIRLSG
ncbi:MAG TPA: DNA polymerase III subunit beta [Mycobacteriales bacterium]|nr:DNA polymerase III subunit beta [Mycobacteriales bacterium]